MKKTILIIFGAGFVMATASFLGELQKTDFNGAAALFVAVFGLWSLFFGGFLLALRLYTQPKLEPGEKIRKFEWGSSDFGRGRMGGMLYLTETRIIFKSHFLSPVKRQEQMIFLHDIAETAKEGQNLIVTTKHGQIVYFLLNDTNDWMIKFTQPSVH